LSRLAPAGVAMDGGIMTSDQDDQPERRTTWTLAAIKQRNLTVDGHYETPGCGHFYEFNLDTLIETAGPDYLMPEIIPGMTCSACGGALQFKLGMTRSNE
jgi:hypothetical protein